MKVFDCFMYFDEDLVLDLRLNTLNSNVDFFVIVESTYNHKGEKRNLKFDIKKFTKFKDKIKYIVYDIEPEGIETISENDNESIKSSKYILNAARRENGQRNYIIQGLLNSDDEDVILISDLDEIPNLSNYNLNNIDQKILLFKQDMFYYKFNLQIPNFKWVGTKACKKKNLFLHNG